MVSKLPKLEVLDDIKVETREGQEAEKIYRAISCYHFTIQYIKPLKKWVICNNQQIVLLIFFIKNIHKFGVLIRRASLMCF